MLNMYCLSFPVVRSHRDSAQLVLFAARYHDSTSFFAYMDLIQYLLDLALSSRITQLQGITAVVDMTGASWKQFDAKILNKFLLFLQDHFPGRLRKFLVVNAPMWVPVLAKAITPWMKPKLASKITFIERKGFFPFFFC